jgi:hypothetical protein
LLYVDWHVCPAMGVSIAETCSSNSRGVVSSVRVAYLETCGARKWGKTGKRGAKYEAGACRMARNVQVLSTSATITLGAGTVTTSDKCFCTDGRC